MTSKLTASDIAAACVCLGVQKAARQVARRYDDALKPFGITSGQFSILSALLRDELVPLGALANILGMDRTTLNRNLMPLEKQKLVATSGTKDDRRVRGIRLTEKGRALLERAIPAWHSAQADSERRLAGIKWKQLRAHMSALS